MTHPNDAIEAIGEQLVYAERLCIQKAPEDALREIQEAKAILAEHRAALTQKPPVIEGVGAATEIVLSDNARMRKAGTALAEAALYVIREYDGTHRLSLAVSEWSKAIADEGGRAPTPPQESVASRSLIKRYTDEQGNEMVGLAEWYYEEIVSCLPDEQESVDLDELRERADLFPSEVKHGWNMAIDHLAATHNITKKGG